MLTNKGVQLPDDFDINKLQKTPKKIETKILTEMIKETKMNDPMATLTQKIQALQQQMQNMQTGATMRYSIQDICPYLFNSSVNMIPFPKHCEFPKFDKYNGKIDPIDHVREFRTMNLEFSHEDT